MEIRRLGFGPNLFQKLKDNNIKNLFDLSGINFEKAKPIIGCGVNNLKNLNVMLREEFGLESNLNEEDLATIKKEDESPSQGR